MTPSTYREACKAMKRNNSMEKAGRSLRSRNIADPEREQGESPRFRCLSRMSGQSDAGVLTTTFHRLSATQSHHRDALTTLRLSGVPHPRAVRSA
jgi:hypothetical protein